MNRLRSSIASLVVALLALAACVTSLGHDFTFDDRYIVLENGRVHQLGNLLKLWRQPYWPPKYGGDGYRPMVMTLFTLEWWVGSGAPWVFHLGNVLLTLACAVMVYRLARQLLPPAPALAAGALFAVHPVHVEVTGNVVGQSELVVALATVLAVVLHLRARARGALDGRTACAEVFLYAVALFTKEHAIVLPALLAAAELTVVRDATAPSARLRALRPMALGMVLVTLVYACARATVQEDIAGFAPYPAWRFLQMSAVDRIGTMMHEMPRIARLLVFPTHLSADYSPPDVVIAKGVQLTELPGAAICLGVVVLALAWRRRAPVASFGLMWTAIAFLPVSNLLVPAGFITAERTLFLPSVGVVLVAGSAGEWIAGHGALGARRLAVAAASLLVVLGIARSVTRQRVWHDNVVLFEQTAKDSPDGYRAHFMRGRAMGRTLRLEEMEHEYRRALQLFPYDAGMTTAIADDYLRGGLCGPAIPLYEWTFAVDSAFRDGRLGYVYCLAKKGDWAMVRSKALEGLRHSRYWEVRYLRDAVRTADSALGRGVRPPLVDFSQSARGVANFGTLKP